MNKFYEEFKKPDPVGGRDFVFRRMVNDYLDLIDAPNILTCGAERSEQPCDRAGDGFADFFWAEVILKKGKGKLTIVDICPRAIEICKEVLSDFIGKIDIEFIVDDGLNWTDKKFDFYYLDAG